MHPLRWPSQCAACGDWADARLCRQCIARFAPPRPRCARCAMPAPASPCGACLREPPTFERTIAVADYGFPWDRLIAQFKFRQQLDLAPALAHLMVQAVRHAAPDPVTLVVPMPLSRQRLAERGYNQSWELARRVARTLGVGADAAVLRRPVDAPHQLSLPREQRAHNVRGTFAVVPRRGITLRGARVALVDDVLTTGATASEATRALLSAGASAVQLWVFARTPSFD